MRIFCAFFVVCLYATNALADIRSDMRDLFTRDMDTLDFTRVKIEVDRMIDPSIDVDTQLAQIDQMVATIRTMLPPNATSWDKL
ncbi:hypothetical protein [Celeribacter baekdonensis]|uniref:hypothetical protein n=1 Tax=Celeribacter baekdonensis TaxID=875171 RepID=UPI0030D9E9B8|tara:strand:+ start:58196 stop:58447 length:252 start_codon:yes stop_codon:yes gene_type:complete